MMFLANGRVPIQMLRNANTTVTTDVRMMSWRHL